jgi:perosamine synthetase
MIPLSKPYLDEQDAQAVADSVRSGWILQGPKVDEFEKLLSDYIGIPYAVTCSSCTTGLHMALLIFGIGPGDEVIVPSYSYIATTNVVVHAGATPVFADIDPTTFNIDPNDIEKKITKKTKAIIAVDQIGLCADWDPIVALTKKHKLKLIEDAACGMAATYKGKNAGTFGDIAVFSFHPKKAITTAEGGLLVTQNKDWSEYAQKLRAHGANISVAQRSKSKQVILEEFPMIGYNYRMSDIHAALGVSQFKKLDTILDKRIQVAMRYTKAFLGHPVIVPPFVPFDYHHTFQTYQVRLKGFAGKKRNEVMQQMLDRGIATRQGIPSAHLQPPYKKLTPGVHLPHTELASDECLCLPTFTTFTKEDQETVIQNLLEVVDSLT